ncbi:MAG: acyl-CoA thioesterase [Ilumatobacteraceae bacterium]
MDSRSFLGLQATHNPYRWHLPVDMRLCTGGHFLYGGAGLGAAISALEGTTGRSLIWSTAQYLSYARPGEVMDIDVIVPVTGNAITQARVVAHVGEREILVVNAALGDRDFPHTGQWETAPAAPPPEECGEYQHRFLRRGTIHDHLEERVVKVRPLDDLDGTHNDGHTIMWTRLPSVIDGVDAAALGVLGDFVPRGVGQAVGIRGGGNSLDNTLRVVNLVPTTWVLIDIKVHGLARGFGHGLVHMYAEDGTLMATASQSCIARIHRDSNDDADAVAASGRGKQ